MEIVLTFATSVDPDQGALPLTSNICRHFFTKPPFLLYNEQDKYYLGLCCQIFCRQWKIFVATLMDLVPVVTLATGRGSPDQPAVSDHDLCCMLRVFSH